MSWLLALLPVLLLTPLLINFVYLANPGFFESHKLGVDTFSRVFLDRNFGENLYFLFNWDGRTVNSPLLSLVGSVSVLLCLLKFARSAPALIKAGDPFVGGGLA